MVQLLNVLGIDKAHREAHTFQRVLDCKSGRDDKMYEFNLKCYALFLGN